MARPVKPTLAQLAERGRRASAEACPECDAPMTREWPPFWVCEHCGLLYELLFRNGPKPQKYAPDEIWVTDAWAMGPLPRVC